MPIPAILTRVLQGECAGCRGFGQIAAMPTGFIKIFEVTRVSHTDSSFLRNMVIIIAALVVFMIIIIIAANWLSNGSTNIQDDPMVQGAIEDRIAPICRVNTGGIAPVAAAAAGPVDGKAIYEQACFACHGTGAAGAPKFGDSSAWSARIGQGIDTLNDHALNGFKGMPPRGGRADLDDDSVKAAVQYMVDGSK